MTFKLANSFMEAFDELTKLNEAGSPTTIRCMHALYEDDDGYVCNVGVYADNLTEEEMEEVLTDAGMCYVQCWEEYDKTVDYLPRLGEVVDVFDVDDDDIEAVAEIAGKDPEEYKHVGFFESKSTNTEAADKKLVKADLDESAQTDELTKLDAEITDLEAEIKDLKTKYETASDKYRGELESTEEYKALKDKYWELHKELWGLKWSYRRYDPYDRDGDEWEVDEEQYEKVKDRIAELEQILKEMNQEYWAPSDQAHARADKEFAYSDKKQKLKANQDKRAQGLANLIAEETPEVTQIVDKLNKDLKEPMFTLNAKAATFKANKLRIPVYTKEFEDEYELDENDFEDFDADTSPSSIRFKCKRYIDYYMEDTIYDLEISPEDLAETFGYKETTDGYKIIEESEWILTKDTETYITEPPEVLELEYDDDGIGYYDYWGQEGYDSSPYVAIESASDTIKYKFIYYLQKNF